jgi:DNA-binding NarL/FixJ family response regulator
MVAVAIFSIDPILRRNLEQLPHDDPAFALVGDHPSSVTSGLVVLPPELLATLLHEAPPADDVLKAQLTRRELEVLAAMADGASNKAIARQLGISFHTAKFHVAAILAKLDADSRTEAVAKAAQSGLVML